MYVERLKRLLPTERGLHLTFSTGETEESIELSLEVANHTLHALQVATSESAGEEPLTLMVFGHQVVRTHEAYGLLLRTQEFGDVVFSLPQAILQRLVTDLVHLASSPLASRASSSGDASAGARGDEGACRS